MHYCKAHYKWTSRLRWEFRKLIRRLYTLRNSNKQMLHDCNGEESNDGLRIIVNFVHKTSGEYEMKINIKKNESDEDL